MVHGTRLCELSCHKIAITYHRFLALGRVLDDKVKQIERHKCGVIAAELLFLQEFREKIVCHRAAAGYANLVPYLHVSDKIFEYVIG